MSYEADKKRFFDKRDAMSLFKVMLMTFEDIRNSLVKSFRHRTFECPSCGLTQVIIDKDIVAWDNKFTGKEIHFLGMAALNDLSYFVHCSCGHVETVLPENVIISAVEVNPTVVNDGLNSAIGSAGFGGTFQGLMCYKFGFHLQGFRSEPVYLVACAKKDKWNFVPSCVCVIRFPCTLRDGSSSPLVVKPFDCKMDSATKRCVSMEAIKEEILVLLHESAVS